MQLAEGMNEADGVAGYGSGVRGCKPGAILIAFVGCCARRFHVRSEEAAGAPAHGLTKHALGILDERKASVVKCCPARWLIF
jgi:hypothetical protein